MRRIPFPWSHLLPTLGFALLLGAGADPAPAQVIGQLFNPFGERKPPVLATTPRAQATLEQAARAETYAQRLAGGSSAAPAPLIKAFVAAAELRRQVNDFARAQFLYLQALAIARASQEVPPADRAAAFDHGAEFFLQIGDYMQAERLIEEGLALCRKEAPATVEAASLLNKLGALMLATNRPAEATQPLREALVLRERLLPPHHVDRAYTLDHLGRALQIAGNAAEAKVMADEAKQILEENRDRNPDRWEDQLAIHEAIAHHTKSIIETIAGGGGIPKPEGPFHLKAADLLMREAQMIWREGQPSGRSDAIKKLRRALDIRTTLAGPLHTDTLESVWLLALLLHEEGQTLAAARLNARWVYGQTALLRNVLSLPEERQRLAFRAMLQPYTLPAARGDVPGLATAAFRFKGAVLDALLADARDERVESDPKLAALRAQVHAAESRLRAFEAADTEPAANDPQRATLRKTLLEAEAVLAGAAGSGALALTATVHDVQAALPAQSSLVEYLRYSRYLGGARFEDCYGAVILCPEGEPQWVELGRVNEIDGALQKFREFGAAEFGKLASIRSLDDVGMDAQLRALHRALWAPVARLLPSDCRRVILSPDHTLNLAPFPVLVDADGKTLLERHILEFVATGRDLLRVHAPASQPSLVAIGNPAYDLLPRAQVAGETVALRGSDTDRDVIQKLSFHALPQTEKEVKDLFEKAKGWNWRVSDPLLQHQATDAELLRVRSPFILHIATHGFWLKDGERLGGSSYFDDPMNRCGLAFTGSQLTLEAWKRGELPPPATDGILTAAEASRLHLEGTWLVTLSACSTALGDVSSGEGVLGLRRAFARAGARNLLITLWRVEDTQTQQLMLRFYDLTQKFGDAAEALTLAQRERFEALRREGKGFSEIVLYCAPFILSGSGRL